MTYTERQAQYQAEIDAAMKIADDEKSWTEIFEAKERFDAWRKENR